MSKKDQNVVETPVVTDPFEYGYPRETQVPIPAELFMALLQIMGAVAQEESKEMIMVNQFPLETGPERDENGVPKFQPEQVILYVTPKGKRAEELFNAIMEVHMIQIESKVAINRNQAEAEQAAPDLEI